MEVDPYKFLLLILNILLPLAIAFYLYYTRKYRNYDEIRYSIPALLLWSLRYIWILMVAFDIQNDILNRLVALDLALLLLCIAIWIKNAFHLPTDTLWGNFNRILHGATVILLIGILIPLSMLLPSDLSATPVRNDINYSVAILIAVFIILLVVLALFRVIPVIVQKRTVFRWYQAGLFSGFFLIAMGDSLFYWIIKSPPLQLMVPIIGSLVILITLIGFRALPFFHFATLVDSGILIVNVKDERVEYLNLTARQYLPEDLMRKSHLRLGEVWDTDTGVFQTFGRVKTDVRVTQIEERIFNYRTRKYQNTQFIFYPLGEETHQPLRIGILMLDSDEIQYLKQRKDFLLDILTHDIANVSQTLSFALDSIRKEDLLDSKNWEIIKMAKDQNVRLKNLIYGAHNLLSIDSVSRFSEIDQDFASFIKNLFQKKQDLHPDFEIKFPDLSSIHSVKSDGTLGTAFELILETIIEMCPPDSKMIEIGLDTDKIKKFQKYKFQFRSEDIKVNLMENYARIDKSELVATSTSPARINLIVATAIIQKNAGEMVITSFPEDYLNYSISISIPIFETIT